MLCYKMLAYIAHCMYVMMPILLTQANLYLLKMTYRQRKLKESFQGQIEDLGKEEGSKCGN